MMHLFAIGVIFARFTRPRRRRIAVVLFLTCRGKGIIHGLLDVHVGSSLRITTPVLFTADDTSLLFSFFGLFGDAG